MAVDASAVQRRLEQARAKAANRGSSTTALSPAVQARLAQARAAAPASVARTNPEEQGGIWNFVKNIPSAIVRGLGGSVIETRAKTQATVEPFRAKVDALIGKTLGIEKAQKFGTDARQAILRGQERMGPVVLPGQTLPIINQIKPFKTPQEAVGSYAEAALDTALLGFAPGAGSVLKGAAKAGIKETVKGLATKQGLKATARMLLADGAVGATYGAATALQQEGATSQDVLRSSLLGFGLGMAAPPVLGGVTRFGTRAIGLAGRQIGEASTKIGTRLEEYSLRSQKEMAALKASEKFLFSQFDVKPTTKLESVAGTLGRVFGGVEKIPLALRRHVETGFAPIGEVEKRAAALDGGLGRGDVEDAFQRTKNVGGDTEQVIRRFIADAFAPFSKEVDLLAKQTVRFRDALDDIQAGKAIEGGISEERLIQEYTAFRKSLTAEMRQQVDQAVAARQNILKELLEESRTVGRRTDEDFNRIMKAHPNYFPHRVEDFTKDMIPQDVVEAAGGSFTAGSLRGKGRKGTKRELEDVDESIIHYIAHEKAANQKQRAVNALFERIRGMEETLGFKKLDEAPKSVDVPKGKGIVTVFQNGKKEIWELPSDVAFVLKNMDPGGMTMFARILGRSALAKFFSLPTSLLRQVAVQKNPLFLLLRNPARDIQTATMLVGNIAKDLLTAIPETFQAKTGVKFSKDYLMAQKESAFIGSILKEEKTSEKILQRVLNDKSLLGRRLDDQGAVKTAQAWAGIYTNAFVGTMEEAVRLAVFKKLTRGGVDPVRAAARARNTTVDFSKMGLTTEVLNRYIPFLNPTVQGTINLSRMFVEKPTEFWRRSMYLAALPAAGLYAWNSRFDAYQNIPEGEKRRNWVFMLTEEQGRDFNGKPTKIPIYISIPKGETAIVISSAVEHSLNSGREQHPQEMAEFLAEAVGSMNPIGNNTFLLPEGMKQAIEVTSNYSFFRESQIEPDWVKVNNKWKRSMDVPPELRTQRTTSEIAKIVGEALGWSPIKIDYVIKTGIIGDFISFADIPIRYFKGEDAPEPGYRSEEDSQLFKMSNSAFIKGVIKSSEQGDIQEKKEAEEAAAQAKTRKEVERAR